MIRPGASRGVVPMLLVLLAVLSGPALGLAFPGGSADCQPGNTVPPTCLVVLDQALDPLPFGLVGQVGTGGVIFWCLGVEQQVVAESLSSGGTVLLDPARARISAGCTPFP